MGLDTVELVMEIEEEFGIDIRNEDAEKILTMADMHHHLVNQFQTREKLPCPNQRAFHQLRSALVEIGGFDRNAISLDSKTQQYLPKRKKLQFWTELGDALNCNLPKLALNSKIRFAVLIVPILFFGIAFVLTYSKDNFFQH